ncbi:exodeoxyribonuclease III [Paramagnetospirillum kuznetsovii]|uniref:Exodeoxyribonuclease III n=1 Tax=Paramagnetospirillum kuznetsovii TaxID=2053833 RepID=A0A364P320_9PROT|nr:exodeoxyribonuclease III [Paramagnetospirillum kuznetsovii]RAU23742.1 exodeoxyribonuclease III [Paramagnetospirillum kuznetsovii]
MRLVTWNINSIRLRMGLLRQLTSVMAPDMICLQEIKVDDPLFPLADCQELGYPHVAFSGMKGYNGVAILSKLPFEDVTSLSRCGRDDRRHLAVKLAGGVQVHSLYIPAGGDIPDPEQNDKFAHKLDFLRDMAAWCAATIGPEDKVIIAGDFNVAPLENDVWSHKQMVKVVSHTPAEVELLERFQASADFVDAMRHFVPPSEKLFTWWSYRSPDWQKNDRGRRLDHVWVTPALRAGLRSTLVAREARSWTQPSDHVPVMVDLDL